MATYRRIGQKVRGITGDPRRGDLLSSGMGGYYFKVTVATNKKGAREEYETLQYRGSRGSSLTRHYLGVTMDIGSHPAHWRG